MGSFFFEYTISEMMKNFSNLTSEKLIIPYLSLYYNFLSVQQIQINRQSKLILYKLSLIQFPDTQS